MKTTKSDQERFIAENSKSVYKWFEAIVQAVPKVCAKQRTI